MTKIKWNPNNTEGHYPTSFDFIETEIRKDSKIVATDLPDLYDVDPSGATDKQILIYDNNRGLWVPGEGADNCTIINENTNILVGENEEFKTLKECFKWLRENCKIISENAIVTIQIVNDLYIDEITCLNHPYGHRIIIEPYGNNVNISVVYNIGLKEDVQTNTYYSNIEINNKLLYISDNHNIKAINNINFIIEVSTYDDLSANIPLENNELFLLIIDNNSYINFYRCSFKINFTGTIPFFYLISSSVKNNSILLIYENTDICNNINIENNSSLLTYELYSNIEDSIIKNNSVILTDDVTKFNNISLINSKLIKRK
jgi:hypothetical protein